jgi:hypothetical protein
MKRIAYALITISVSTTAWSDDSVRGHMRRDGTYVAPHHRTDQNQYRFDNYSSQGNTNPYTGQRGSQRNEFSSPPAYNRSNPYGGSTFTTPQAPSNPYGSPYGTQRRR